MAFIPSHQVDVVKKQLAEGLARIVTVHLFVEPESKLFIPGRQRGYNKETRELLEEVASLTDKLELKVYDLTEQAEAAAQHGVERVPALVLAQDGVNDRVKFYGFPGGYEFTTLLESLVRVSNGSANLSPDARKRVQAITQPLHLQVFTTPT